MPATVAGLIAYALDRGTVIANDAATAAALVRARDYIQYGYLQFGSCTEDSETVQSAIYEASIVEVATPNFWTATFTPSQQKVLTGLKGITWTVVGGASGFGSASPRSTKIDNMLRLCGSFGGTSGFAALVV